MQRCSQPQSCVDDVHKSYSKKGRKNKERIIVEERLDGDADGPGKVKTMRNWTHYTLPSMYMYIYILG